MGVESDENVLKSTMVKFHNSSILKATELYPLNESIL